MITRLKTFFTRAPRRKKTLLFYIKFRKMQGGHLKAWHYFRHTLQSDDWTPRVYFDPASTLDKDCFWWAERRRFASSYEPEKADAVFVTYSGAWDVLARSHREHGRSCPALALVQGLRHADPQHYLHTFLRQPAVRICVSAEVATAVRASGITRGPVFTNPAATDLPTLGYPPQGETKNGPRERKVVIAGLKNPALAMQLEAALRREGVDVFSIIKPLPREKFLYALASAETAVFLPLPREGFYLPALEAMALGTLVICPDVGGNRGFCTPDENCFRPEYSAEAILAAWRRSEGIGNRARERTLEAAFKTAREHSLEEECRRYLAILGQLETLWRAEGF